MDKDLVTQIAQQIVSQEILRNWNFYLVVLLLSFLSAAFSSFVLPYLKRRGEQFATKAEMDSIVKQLEQTTQTAKSIESKISIDEWSHKEYRSIRRQKLEELVLAVHRVDGWLEKQRNWRIYEGAPNGEPWPMDSIELLVTLYFSELDLEVARLKRAFVEHWRSIIRAEAKLKLAKLAEDSAARAGVLSEYANGFEDQYTKLMTATAALSVKARKIMVEILTH
jgi:hypothetical protein